MQIRTDEALPRSDPRNRLAVGDAAPDVEVLDTSGRSVSLADLWRRGPIVLTFLRHFG
jgi:peroxiredoxin